MPPMGPRSPRSPESIIFFRAARKQSQCFKSNLDQGKQGVMALTTLTGFCQVAANFDFHSGCCFGRACRDCGGLGSHFYPKRCILAYSSAFTLVAGERLLPDVRVSVNLPEGYRQHMAVPELRSIVLL